MSCNSTCCAILVAAGSSTRMGMNRSKLFIPLLGNPAIAYTLSSFQKADCIQQIILVCRKEDIEEMKIYINQYQITKVTSVVIGGSTRQESVIDGIQKADANTDYFVIHDGARPLISPEAINRAVEDAKLYRASALGVPVKDTVKILNENGFVVSTPNRSTVWAVQTPQVFEKKLYTQALEQAVQMGADYTDDCQLIEHLGVKVHLCLGEYTNIKLTTKEDIAFAEAILKKAGQNLLKEGQK